MNQMPAYFLSKTHRVFKRTETEPERKAHASADAPCKDNAASGILLDALNTARHESCIAPASASYPAQEFSTSEVIFAIQNRTIHLMQKNRQSHIESLTQAIEFLQKELAASKKTETALRESEARFRAIFDYTAIGLAQIAEDGRFVEVNPAFCKLLGYTRDELLCMTYLGKQTKTDAAAFSQERFAQ